MRRGLVLAGGGLVALGLLVVGVGLLNLPQTNTILATQPIDFPLLLRDSNHTEVLNPPIPALTGGTITVQAQSNGSLNLYLLSGGCSIPNFNDPNGSCVLEIAYVTPGAAPTTLTLSPATSFPYVLDVVNRGTTTASVSGSVVIDAKQTTGLSLWEATVIMAAGGLLAAMGAIALFLGLFLGGGVYSNRTMPEKLPPLEGEEEPKPAAEREEAPSGEKREDETPEPKEKKNLRESRSESPPKPSSQPQSEEEKTLW